MLALFGNSVGNLVVWGSLIVAAIVTLALLIVQRLFGIGRPCLIGMGIVPVAALVALEFLYSEVGFVVKIFAAFLFLFLACPQYILCLAISLYVLSKRRPAVDRWSCVVLICIQAIGQLWTYVIFKNL